MKAIFHSTVNPLPWIDTQVNAVEHTNFFENRATEYAKVVHREIGRIYFNGNNYNRWNRT